MMNVHYPKRIRNPFTTFFQMQTHQAVLEGISILLLHIYTHTFTHLHKRIRMSDLTRRYCRNIIYKWPITELFDTDRLTILMGL